MSTEHRDSFNYQRRERFRNYLHGEGIEIGALHQPLDVSGLPITRIRYVDRYDVAQLREHYPELALHTIIPVDIVDDGQVLSKIPNESLDFIIANSMIEHSDNPLGAIENRLAKLRVGGVIYLAVPDKRVGWDERRPLTPLSHILEDYRCDNETRGERNYHHFEEWVDFTANEYTLESEEKTKRDAQWSDLLETEQRTRHINWLYEIDYSIHYHVFTFDSFRELLHCAKRELEFPFEVVDFAKPVRDSWEAIFILRKVDDANESAKSADSRLADHAQRADPPLVTSLRQSEIALDEAEAELARSSIKIHHAETKRWEADFQLWKVATEFNELKIKWQEMVEQLSLKTDAAAQIEGRLRTIETEILPQVAEQLSQKTDYALETERRLAMIETEVLPAKNAYIAVLETELHRFASNKVLRIGRRLWQFSKKIKRQR